MNKILKIGGIVLGAIVFLFIAVMFLNFSKNTLSMPSASFESESMAVSAPGSSMAGSFSSPLSMGSARSEKSTDSSIAPVYDAGNSQNMVEADKKIIKNGNLTLKVDSTDEAESKITEVAKNNSGEVLSSSFYRTVKNVKSGSITVKVPVANFEKAFVEIKKVASLVVRESTSGQDVTEQYIDLQAQLKNRQAEEQSFVKILDQAQKIQDVLDVTAQLARVRGNIEQLQGRIKYLDSQTDMSTILVNLSEDQSITVIDSWRPWQVVKDSFNSLIKGLQGFVNFLIRFFIALLPLLIIWAIIIWVVYRIGKKIYQKIKSKQQIQ
ncbi:MAG TPA: DUF4349 domain-containing protein [Candidatus Moranbacteria bacterium]|nr:DUF4349 domain-containing protein [Candidatus Moranbacteria bacterium]